MTTPEQNQLIPVVRIETVRMSQLSLFGHEVTQARWRNTNPDLYRFIEGLHPLMIDTVSPMYNLIWLEHELRRMRIPRVTPETIGEFTPPASLEEVNVEEFQAEQPHLHTQLDTYISVLSTTNPVLAEATQFAFFDTYLLLKTQAKKDTSPS